MACSRVPGSSYDVFLSFRGEDTRHAFTDHLCNALRKAGILAFRDSDDAERGEELKQEIKKAIKASDASIIVLSENYATSTWCLEELSLILEQRRDCNHFVLPVFYYVDPSDVGNQNGSFKIAASSSGRWTDDNVKRWKAALTEVVGVVGMPLVDGYALVDGSEVEFINTVVNTIYNRLERRQIYIPRHVTGMDARYKEIVDSWLTLSETQFLVIYGIAGSGKSTLAQYIVYSYCQHFESYSLIENIGTRCKTAHDMVMIQEQLCSDISKGKEGRIRSVRQGRTLCEVLLGKTKALIILDDIVKECQLEDLLGSGNISKESKIIITTNNDTSNWFLSKSKRYQEHKMKLLNDDESMNLLSLHAFGSNIPKDGYTKLMQQVVKYCEGNPLALEVLGSSLSKKDTITSWESELRSFEAGLHSEIFYVFKRSYDSLPTFEKELFLHIAIFFVGEDMDYVVKILEPDYAAESKIKTLIERFFLYVTPDKKLMMHRLLQEMGRSLVDQESRIVSERSRVWRNKDSYEMLRRKKSSMTIEGLAIDIQLLMEEDGFSSRKLKKLSTDSLQKMDRLKLLKLNFAELTGSFEDLSEHLRWLCWVGFNESTIHSDIFMGNLVALDMSYSSLKLFEPPTVLESLKILNLKDSHNLLEIRNIDRIPNLETLIIWNCHNLFHVSETIGNLERLAFLKLTGCKKLCNREQIISTSAEASTSGGESRQEPSFPLPHTLQRLFINKCNLECTNYFPLSFNDQLSLLYLNLANGLFEILPSYNHLRNLLVLDLRKCPRLKRLLCLPSTLAELHIYHCKSIEKITFESGRFTLQEFGCEGCVILSEIEGLFKLLLVAKLDEADLGHMIWLKEFENHEVCLCGDDELTKGRSWHLQMLYEVNIMSISLLDIKHPKLMCEYMSQSMSLAFEVPSCPRNSSLKGLNITFRYKISCYDDSAIWFCKISMTSGDDLIYSPKVFGKPASGEVGIWLSYWPIGNSLDVGDEVNVSIVVLSGLEVLECGASLVYTDDDVEGETMENKMGWLETCRDDLSRFQLSNGSYYLCQRDFYKLMEVGRLSPDWLRILVGDAIEDTEVRGWRMSGRPQQMYQSLTELKTGICTIPYGPETEEKYRIAEISNSSFLDKTLGFTSSIQGKNLKSGITSEFSDFQFSFQRPMEISETMKFTSKSPEEKMDHATSALSILPTKAQELAPNTDPLGKREKLELRKLKDVEVSESYKNVSELGACRRFSLAEIRSATNDFDDKLVIGRGEYGNVYKGKIDSEETGYLVAIKQLDSMFQQGEAEYRAEIEMLSKLRHRHLVSLIGYCDDNKEMIIVYEYMPNGTLYDHLHLTNTPLNWVQRLNIAIGAARGLDYLHTGTRHGIIHRDVKSANILLDENWEAMISGFGLSKIASTNQSSSVKGTFGYLDPEYLYTGILTRKTDVYAFGVVLCELLSGRHAVYTSSGEDLSLVRWLDKCVKEGKVDEMVDPNIGGTIAPKCLQRFSELANSCLLSVPKTRPTITEVVASLQTLLNIQEKYDESCRVLINHP